MAQLVQLFQKYFDNSEAGFHSHIWHFEYLIEFFYIQVRFLTDNISELLFPYLVWFWWDFARLPQVVKLYLCTTRLLNGSVQGSAVSAALGSWVQFLLIILCNSSSVQFLLFDFYPANAKPSSLLKWQYAPILMHPLPLTPSGQMTMKMMTTTMPNDLLPLLWATAHRMSTSWTFSPSMWLYYELQGYRYTISKWWALESMRCNRY